MIHKKILRRKIWDSPNSHLRIIVIIRS